MMQKLDHLTEELNEVKSDQKIIREETRADVRRLRIVSMN